MIQVLVLLIIFKVMSLQGSLDRIECLFSKDMKREISVGLKRIILIK